MGKKPDHTCKIKISRIVVNGLEFNSLEIDLVHVNFGTNRDTDKYNKKRRSHFTGSDIAQLVEKNLHNVNFQTIAVHDNSGKWHFVKAVLYHESFKYRLIFCYHDEEIEREYLAVITFFKIR